MATVDPLSFVFEENPHWRDHDHTTGQMIGEIATFREKYRGDAVAKEFSEEFARAMTVDYIYHLNVGEMVGTQTQEGTEAVLNFVMAKRRTTAGSDVVDQKPKTKEERESVNTYRAMAKLHGFHSEMKNTGILTVQQICNVHRVLMDGLRSDAGNVYTYMYVDVHVRTTVALRLQY